MYVVVKLRGLKRVNPGLTALLSRNSEAPAPEGPSSAARRRSVGKEKRDFRLVCNIICLMSGLGGD